MRRTDITKRFREFLSVPRTVTDLIAFVHANYDPEWLAVRASRRWRSASSDVLVSCGAKAQVSQLLSESRRPSAVKSGTLEELVTSGGVKTWQWLPIATKSLRDRPRRTKQKAELAWQRHAYAVKRAQGRCVRCKDVAVVGKAMCEMCTDKHRECVRHSAQMKKGGSGDPQNKLHRQG